MDERALMRLVICFAKKTNIGKGHFAIVSFTRTAIKIHDFEVLLVEQRKLAQRGLPLQLIAIISVWRPTLLRLPDLPNNPQCAAFFRDTENANKRSDGTRLKLS